jgi:hypothetical protein
MTAIIGARLDFRLQNPSVEASFVAVGACRSSKQWLASLAAAR